VAGRVKNSTKTVASLVDTNILVYRCDPRDSGKRAVAHDLLRRGAASGELHIPHQALVEFVRSATRVRETRSLMSLENATRQAEEYMEQFPILYPDEHVFRLALRGMAAYRLAWFDAHFWAYAERYGMSEILSEDFEHGRRYGTVRVRNPFIDLG
jgi:predicted nucleic acid-binding protein